MTPSGGKVGARRIIFFSPGLSEGGGAQRRSQTYADGFAARGWDVKVVARSGTLRRFVLRRENNLFILEVPGFSSVFIGGLLFLCVAIPVGIYWGLRSRGFVAIQFGSQATAAGICSSLTRRPFFVFGSSTGPLSELRLVLSRRTGGFRARLLRRAAALVTQTEDGAAEVRELLPGVPVEVIPTPVRPMVASPLTGKPNVLFIGRLSKEKDLERLLDAWPAVVGDRPDASLTLAGDGGAYRSVESILKQRVSSDPVLSSSVVLLGWVDDVSALLSANDVFVFPSLSEGMSNALLEAAAAGRVIVASDIPANRAVLGDDYPLLFEAGDTDALGRTLRSAITDEKVRALACDRLASRIDSFSERRIVDRVEGMVEGAYRARNQHP